MAEITLAKALKIKNRLAGRRAKVQADIQAFNSVLKAQAGEVHVTALVRTREELVGSADFARITNKYARGKKDFVFATMRFRFDDADNPTYGALVRRNVAADAPDRFVPVIDCRGGKLARRFFTRWHENAHRLKAFGRNRWPAQMP